MEYFIRFEVFTAVTMKSGRLLGCYAVALVRTDVSEELSASIIRVIRISELGILAVTSNQRTLLFSVIPLIVILVT
jgi:hypothetical protein